MCIEHDNIITQQSRSAKLCVILGDLSFIGNVETYADTGCNIMWYMYDIQ